LHLSLDSREVGRVSIVRWYGRTVAGSESESLRAHVAWLLRDRRSIVLHLGDVGFIDSSGPGTMVRTLTSTRQARGRLDVAVTKKINLLKRGSFPGSCPVARYSARADIVKTNFSDDTPTLYLNRGDNNFDEVTFSSGLGKIKNWLGWGVQFYDFDNSGWPGILIATGHVYLEVDGKALSTGFREPKVAYYNLRDGTCANITCRCGIGSERATF
jgi:hypothetical protein